MHKPKETFEAMKMKMMKKKEKERKEEIKTS